MDGSFSEDKERKSYCQKRCETFTDCQEDIQEIIFTLHLGITKMKKNLDFSIKVKGGFNKW